MRGRLHCSGTEGSYLGEPGVAFCTGELKKASLKKCSDPLKTTLALFLAWRPAIRRVFLPTAWGYCGEHTQINYEANRI